MTIYPICTSMMKYQVFQRAVEVYYRKKIKKDCFVIMQNNRWTLVTLMR